MGQGAPTPLTTTQLDHPDIKSTMEVTKLDSASVNGRQQALLEAFQSEFGEAAQVMVRVPGRVNIIGEHIDYCGYAVHPMAIEQDLLVAAARDQEGSLVIQNMDTKYEKYQLESQADITVPKASPKWWGYVLSGLPSAHRGRSPTT